MDRYNFYFRQPVTEAEMDAAFAAAESALWNLSIDADMIGIMQSAVVTQNATPNLTVNVSGSAAIYDKAGQRIAFSPNQNVDVSQDYLSVSTAVSTPGNQKIISLFAKFDRTLSDPRIDGNSLTVYWSRAESFDFYVTQGSESAAPATPPALHSEYILLADIRRSYGVTTITNADITGPTGTYTGHSDRREDAFVITEGGVTLRAGTAEEIAQDLFTQLGSGTGISFTATAAWADSSSLAATNVSAAINEILSDLASATDGTKRIGSPATGNWHDGTAVAAGTAWSQINTIVADLAETTGAADCGADRVGSGAYTGSGPANPLALLAGSIMDQLKQIVDSFNKYNAANTWSALNTFSAGLTISNGTFTLNGSIVHQGSGRYHQLATASSTLTWFDSSVGQLMKLYEDGSGIEIGGAGIVLGSAANLKWGYTDVTTARTVEINKRSGTGANDGIALQLYGQPGQSQLGATPNNDGGPLEVGGAAPGTGGSGAAGEYGPFQIRRNGNSTTKQYTRNFDISGTGTYNFLSPDGDLASGEAAFYKVEVLSVGDPTPASAHPCHQRFVMGHTGRDSTTNMYSVTDLIQNATQGTNYQIDVTVSATGNTPRVTFTGNNAGFNKNVTAIIHETRCPAP